MLVKNLQAHRETSHSVILDWDRDPRDTGDGKFEVSIKEGKSDSIIKIDDNFIIINDLKPETTYTFVVNYRNVKEVASITTTTLSEVISNNPVESISFLYDELNAPALRSYNLRLEAYPLGTSEGACKYEILSYEGDGETESGFNSERGVIVMRKLGDVAHVRATNIANPELTADVKITATDTSVPIEDITFNDGTKTLDVTLEEGTIYPIRTIFKPTNGTGYRNRMNKISSTLNAYTFKYINGRLAVVALNEGEAVISIGYFDDSGADVRDALRMNLTIIPKKEPEPEPEPEPEKEEEKGEDK